MKQKARAPNLKMTAFSNRKGAKKKHFFFSFFYQISDSFKWKLDFGGIGEYPVHDKQCIETNLDIEHNIKHEFGAISWFVGWNSNSTGSCFASYVNSLSIFRIQLRMSAIFPGCEFHLVVMSNTNCDRIQGCISPPTVSVVPVLFSLLFFFLLFTSFFFLFHFVSPRS